MAVENSPIGLSPLDQIRQAEAGITRRIVAARENAEQILVKTHKLASGRIREAENLGSQEGQTLYKEIISRAEEKAEELIAHAQQHATELQRKGNQCLEQAIQDVIEIVIG